jgi:cobalt/nickel transport system permease protein
MSVHIPDGFLDAKTWVTTTAVGALAVGYALRKSKLTVEPQQIPQLALIGAFIFAAQMINFPVMGATSGHFLGAALSAILFGPRLSIILISCVLIIQALIFQDGGITVLGANILCSAALGSYTGYYVHRVTQRFQSTRAHATMTFFAGWLSLVVAASGIACLLAISGIVSWSLAFGAMIFWHSLIGIGEGLITAFVLVYLKKRNWHPKGVALHEA